MNRLTNGQRDALVKLPVWTTEADRRVALSYAHRHLDGVEEALAAVRAGQPTPANFGEILAVARYENAGWMPDGCFEQWRRWVIDAPRGVEQKTAETLVAWLGDVERRMQQDLTLAMPAGLDNAGRRAHAIIVAYLKQHELTPTGGKAFYAPAEWREREELYGVESHLVVVYDGGTMRPAFSMDAAYERDCDHYRQTGEEREPYALYEGMQAKLREAGLYFEECTGWYSAVYSTGAAPP